MKRRNQMLFLSPDELLSLLAAARQHSNRAWSMVCTSYWHALRASEVCGLTFADIDKENDALTVRRLKDSLETKQAFRKQRGVPLLDEEKALRAWLLERPADDQSSFVYTSQKGSQMHRTAFWRMFQDVAEAAGLPKEKRNPRVLKHSLASHMVAAGENLAHVQQALGHRSYKSTLCYVGVSDSQADVAVQRAASKLF
jgi:integrase